MLPPSVLGRFRVFENNKNVVHNSRNIICIIITFFFSTDTPLGTLHKLKERQKESATPYVVLTGNREQYEQIKK